MPHKLAKLILIIGLCLVVVSYFGMPAKVGAASNNGTCVSGAILMYHHIAPASEAKVGKFASLNVTPEFLTKHIEYLQAKGYNFISGQQLVDFVNGGGSLPKKPVLLTFDDGYQDFYTNAYPILRAKNVPAVMFLPTGLMDNGKYLSWGQISEMASSGSVEFGNHTWSHYPTYANKPNIASEITLAQNQLTEHGFNGIKIFAYPYGSDSAPAEKILTEQGFNAAVGTRYGKQICTGRRLSLPRVRAGNTSLTKFGL